LLARLLLIGIRSPRHDDSTKPRVLGRDAASGRLRSGPPGAAKTRTAGC